MTAASMLILMRHGQAEPYRLDDASRALVPAGVAEVERSTAFLQRQGYVPTTLLASPYRRAQQTAAIVQQQLVPALPLITENALQPDSEPALAGSLLAALLEEAEAGRRNSGNAGSNASTIVMAATHMPLVAALLRYFTGKNQSFATGSLVVLERLTLELLTDESAAPTPAVPAPRAISKRALTTWRLAAQFDPSE